MQLHKQKIFSSLAAVDTYDMILNHALLMGGEEIRGTHIAPLGHVAVYNNNSKHLRCGNRKGLLGRNDQTHHRMDPNTMASRPPTKQY